MYTACTRPCRWSCTCVHGSYTAMKIILVHRRVHGLYMTVYTATPYSWPCTGHAHGRVHGPYTYTAVYTGGVHRRPCTRAVKSRVHAPTLPCSLHGPYTCMAAYTGRGTAAPPLSKFTGAGFACVRIIRDPCLLWANG